MISMIIILFQPLIISLLSIIMIFLFLIGMTVIDIIIASSAAPTYFVGDNKKYKNYKLLSVGNICDIYIRN
jgi:hypothetical protein